jgi:hypothetical protein
MANPELAIAKATFSASLFRKDPATAAPCTRYEVDQFHQLLQDAVRQCSPLNVQVCYITAIPESPRLPSGHPPLS